MSAYTLRSERCSSHRGHADCGVGGARTSAELTFGPIAQGTLAALAGVIIGAVSTILGVAGGELIIPTLVLLFGVPIKAAGTTSLLISIPTMLVGLARHRARGSFQEVAEPGASSCRRG